MEGRSGPNHPLGVSGDTCPSVESVSGPVERLALAQLLASSAHLAPALRPHWQLPSACPACNQPALTLGDESPIKRPGSPRRRHHQPAGSRRLHCFALIGGQELAGANERRLLVGR